MDLMAGIGAITQAIGIAKTLKEVEKTYDEATYKIQISELIGTLTDAKLALADAKEALADKDQEIAKLKAAFEVKATLIPGRGGYNYLTTPDGMPNGYPVCPKCELDGKIVQLKQDGGLVQGRCPSCLTTYRPVTSFVPREVGGPVPAEMLDQEQRAREAALATERIRRAGQKLA